MVDAREACWPGSEGGASVVLTVAEALAWYLIHPYDERNLYLDLFTDIKAVNCAQAASRANIFEPISAAELICYIVLDTGLTYYIIVLVAGPGGIDTVCLLAC
jgi:hypothetical protein